MFPNCPELSRAGTNERGRIQSASLAASSSSDGSARMVAAGGAFIVLASLQFGVVVVLGRIVTHGPRGMPVPTMLAIRFGVAAVLLFVVLVALRRTPLPARGERLSLAMLAIGGYAVESSL